MRLCLKLRRLQQTRRQKSERTRMMTRTRMRMRSDLTVCNIVSTRLLVWHLMCLTMCSNKTSHDMQLSSA